MTFETILPGAWELKQDEPCQLFALHVPTAWRQVANTLNQKHANTQGKKYHALPVRSLDRLVAGGFPKIVHAFRQGGWQQPNKPWLLATERMENLAISALPLLIKDWMREEFSSLEQSEVESSLAKLKDEDWSWEKEPKTYSLLYPNDQDEESVLYNAIPDYLTQEFLKESPIVCFGATGKPLNFYRVVRFEGAELMSWPPQPVLLTNYKGEERTERAFISFVIRFVLQSVPWRKAPLIYHHLSVRRWIVEPLERVPYRGATAYIGSELRLIDGKPQALCFIPLPLKRWQGETK